MDKNIDNSAALNEIHTENEKQTPSFMQKFKNQIAKIEEKFQNRSAKPQNLENAEEGMSTTMTPNGTMQATEQSEQPQSKKGMKFGIRVFPPNVNEKLFGKSRSKSPEVVEKKMVQWEPLKSPSSVKTSTDKTASLRVESNAMSMEFRKSFPTSWRTQRMQQEMEGSCQQTPSRGNRRQKLHDLR
jgi:hypothetical protein